MKKVISTISIFTLILIITSCSKEVKKASGNNFAVEPLTTSINWTAYKTTDKVPVNGKFTKVKVIKQNNGATPIDALNGLEFSIPISSLVTGDITRDPKIKESFFGKMINTSEITGVIKTNNENAGSVKLKMNGVSQELPISYIISGQMVSISAVMNLDNWQAQGAISALNLVCQDLHKGSDGISKTWSEVKIDVVAYLKKVN